MNIKNRNVGRYSPKLSDSCSVKFINRFPLFIRLQTDCCYNYAQFYFAQWVTADCEFVRFYGHLKTFWMLVLHFYYLTLSCKLCRGSRHSSMSVNILISAGLDKKSNLNLSIISAYFSIRFTRMKKRVKLWQTRFFERQIKT